jgi:hypothetical protein
VRVIEELLERQVAVPVYKTEINDRRGSAALTMRHPSIHKSWHYISSTSGGRSVGIVRLRTKGHGVCFVFAGSQKVLSYPQEAGCTPFQAQYFENSGRARNRTRDLCICGQELCPLDQRGGLAADMASFNAL